MTLDDRGRRAAHHLRQRVQDAPLLLMEAGVPATRRAGGASRLLSFAGAFAAVVLVVGLAVLQVDLFAPDQETPTTDMTFPVNTTTTTTAATVPTTQAPVVPERTTTTEASTTTSTPIDDVAPDLMITYPENGAVLDQESIRFEGTTEPGAIVATGPYRAEVDEDGHWAIVLLLNPGGNLAKFTAVDAAGNSSVASVSVTYEVPEPPKEEPPPEIEFTAFSKWGSCTESPPYDEYYGTAKPGTTIEVVSEYGSGWTEAAANGEWYVKVFFETAPPGKTFLVKAKDAFGSRVDFEFVSLVE